MIVIPAGVRIHLALGATDMRKGMDGLALLVQQVLRQDPFSGHLFIFRDKSAQRRSRVHSTAQRRPWAPLTGASTAARSVLPGPSASAAEGGRNMAPGRGRRPHVPGAVAPARAARRSAGAPGFVLQCRLRLRHRHASYVQSETKTAHEC